MSLLYLVGPRLNLLENAVSITASPAADSLFPTTKLADGDPGKAFKFGSLTSAPSLTFDLDALSGTGGFESWSGGTPVGWTESNSGSGHVDEIVGGPGVYEGGRSAEFDCDDGGAAEATLIKDIVVRPGQTFKLTSALYDSGASAGSIGLLIRNQETGNYLTPAAAWEEASTFVHPTGATTGGAYDTYSTTFTVEPYSTVKSATCTLRLQLKNSVTGTVSYADAVYLLPGVTFGSIHGHNIDPRCGLVLQSSPDNSAWTTRATFTVRKPSAYVTCSVQYLRYWRLLWSATNGSTAGAIWVGEAVLGEYATMGTGPAYALGIEHSDPQIRIPRRVGAPVAYQLSQFTQRTVPLTFRCENKTRQLEVLEWLELSRGGRPVVIVPHDADSFTDVIYGRMAPTMPHSWATRSFVTVETSLEEMAFPLVTA